MGDYEMSALDAYLNRAFNIIIGLPLTGATTSAFVFTIFKLIGWWPDISMSTLVIYDIINAFYFCYALYLLKTCKDKNGTIKPEKMRQGKYFVGFIVVAQWNCISYMIPDREWWAYLFFFIALTIVFFDIRFTSILTALLLGSTFISWIVNGEYQFLAFDDALFWPTFVLRLFCIGLTVLTLLSITYFGGRYLVEELEKNVNYDTLTHLLNRRSMDKHLNNAYNRAQKGEDTFCLLLLDIDDFKRVNDTYGHDCGDKVLRYVAHAVSTCVKKDDYVFRWGGEEILVLLKTDLERSIPVAERIRREISKDPIVYKKEIKVSVTVTIGVSSYDGERTVAGMIEDADAKLYYGKRHGKNQVVSE
ncbi:GGDEF domain-containing protein [Oribacterium sp. WCC10]|uniref:GGDEF domain-containing protein n=1 Tax=Oribacterium sp. WCC10 TaxID=1855343 RepID=UPI0008EC067B|nr:GGDEF domain-containing protein [Oribacterium sp. WCC10]SFG44551.1 diguanylate cyclase (GGDEF) domain-containing protein [Oribacterium sp. WCC10]